MSVLKMFFFGSGQLILSPDIEINVRSRKEFALLAYLAIESERPHNRETLLGLLWPELSQDQARNNLRVALARLRKSIKQVDPALIQSTRLTLRFNKTQLQPGNNAWLDVAEFERLLALVKSHDHADPIQCPTCLGDMSKASELYQAEFLNGFHLEKCEAFDLWLLVQRERYHMQIMDLLPRLEAAHIASANWKAAEEIVRQRLALDPLEEHAHRSLIRILALSGLRTAALSHYELCVNTLDEELGIPPAQETTKLVEQIRAGDLAVLTEPSAQTTHQSPLHPVISSPASHLDSHLDPYAVLARLDPLSDQKLFGVDKVLDAVIGAINAKEQSWLVSIEGIGGLGKTTLANAVVKELVNEYYEVAGLPFVDIAWVSAKQEEYLPDRGVQSTGKAALDAETLMDQLLAQLADGPYPTGNTQEKRLALTQLLKEKTCLIVIDNLETAIDYQALLPLLRHLANPTKFLITSRVTLSGQGDLFCYSLAELAQADALAFLRHEATSRGMTNLIAAPDEQLSSIYQTVGGNPLALKLVLSQLQFLPLDQILESLRQADSEHTDQLYTYIYWQTWQMLDATSRHLLLCLPIIPNATFAQLATISGLAADPLQRALMDLRNFSLVELGGDLTAPRYRLHRLTETFLMHEVVKWQRAAVQGDVDEAVQTTVQVIGQTTEQTTEETHYFIQRVLFMVEQWNAAEAVHEVDVTILEHEYESVVKAISLGLELEEGWATVKPLIITFTPFMERRGHWHTWHSILERAIDAARCSKDVDAEITLTALLARLCQRESRPKDVVYYYRRVICMARRNGNRFEEARACSNLGYAYINSGRWWRSEMLSCHALKVFNELKSEHGQAHTHNHLGVLYTRQEEWKLALENLTVACQIWEKNADSYNLITGYANLGLMYVSMTQPTNALKHLRLACKKAKETGELSSLADIWNNIAFAHRLKLDWAEAHEYAKKAEASFKEHSNFLGLAQVWNNLGLIAYGSENSKAALDYLEMSFDIYQKLNNQWGICTVQNDLKRVAAQ